MHNDHATWDVFISYASENRDAVAAPLAQSLEELGLRVWFDITELKVGDSLRERIDAGLSQSRYGVVVLSTAFFAKHWPTRELNGLAQRETEGRKVILPIWHGVDDKAVRRFSPPLADRVALRWTTPHEAAAKLVEVIRPGLSPTLREVLPGRDLGTFRFPDRASLLAYLHACESGHEYIFIFGDKGYGPEVMTKGPGQLRIAIRKESLAPVVEAAASTRSAAEIQSRIEERLGSPGWPEYQSWEENVKQYEGPVVFALDLTDDFPLLSLRLPEHSATAWSGW